MFEALCFFEPSHWKGISYAGGGLNTHHDNQCAIKYGSSERDRVIPMTSKELGYATPEKFMLGHGKEGMWAGAKGPHPNL
ncbi:hypothetical protein GUITHDRAFT_119043 [Guillardia theta CCMP2712]|uniref:Uncharacterized protein n=1 Tax=Guillardia theta (strain CCMP2712) TaxID=905079 RepID=L1IES3_GUITC|nr:hypothetical protein GUITHDRAFT_119043 [Guillardia theta CCMP2712]EKX34733.1 hypothetical protein GUITHDRAFT_119043 [Guillardia theta CCMP2712]|eukprot:XP_005821713.1 hypothetical protein GUITHDRAFT_119043 [Guillardia theta CCMP2712]